MVPPGQLHDHDQQARERHPEGKSFKKDPAVVAENKRLESKDDGDKFSDITDFNKKEGDEVKWLGDDWM